VFQPSFIKKTSIVDVMYPKLILVNYPSIF